MNELLRVESLTKRRKGFTLDNIGFSLMPGYIMGLIGPNGAGKTTTIRLIMNMIQKDGGTVTLCGRDNVMHETEIKQDIGYVSDENLFIDSWSSSEIVKMMEMYYPRFKRDVYYRFLDRFEIPRNRQVKDFSKGMKTKNMIAAVLARDVRLLLLDEPTSGLDPVVRAELLDLLQEYIVGGDRSVLFSTHITTDLEKIADYITFLNHGRLMFSQSRDEVLDRYLVIRGRTDSLDREAKEKLIGMRRTSAGFEGLCESKDRRLMPQQSVFERATLDDIVIFHTMGVPR